MNLYVFSSKSLNNIWAGIGANKWAVQVCDIPNLKEKAMKMPLGALGLFYCSDSKVQGFTTPFIVTKEVEYIHITNIWEDEWMYPFGIKTFGNPNKVIHKNDIGILHKVSSSPKYWNHVMGISPIEAFVPIEISIEDWEILIKRLIVY